MAVILRYALLALPFLSGWFSKGREGAKKANDGTGGTLGKAALWFGAVWLLDKFILSKLKDAETEKIGTDAAATLANRIREAFRLYEVFGVRVLGNTDEESLFAIAGEIRAQGSAFWERVKSSYSTQFGESLIERLRAELSADEFQKFLSILNGQTTAPTTPKPTTPTAPTTPGTTTGVPLQVIGKTATVTKRETLYTVAKTNGKRTAVATLNPGDVVGTVSGIEWQTVGGVRELYYTATYRANWWNWIGEDVIFYSKHVKLS